MGRARGDLCPHVAAKGAEAEEVEGDDGLTVEDRPLGSDERELVEALA